MFKRVLVPLDRSALSERVLPIAKGLARSFGSRIDLVYVVPTLTEDIPEEFIAQASEEAEAYLKGIHDGLSAELGAERIGYSVQRGYPASVIIEQAESQDDTLVLMSTHGYSGVQRLLLGSEAGKVVHAAATPVLLIPADAKNPQGNLVEFKRLIVPLDGSELAETILPYVSALCKSLGMELILVRSYNPHFPGSSIRKREISQIVRDSAEAYIKEKAAQLKKEGVEKVSYKVLEGLPTQQIVDFAIDTPNSVTALCTHGRHGISRWMLGSVTNGVIQCSEEPVLVIRCVAQGQ
ncbi:MAG: universal stress protein [Sedimenticolaceae bacterium]